MKKIHIVADKDANYYLVEDYKLLPVEKEFIINIKEWNDHDEQEHKTIYVFIQKTFLVDIHAKFIMNGDSPFTMDRGFREVYGLGYSFSVNIIAVGNTYNMYSTDSIYSEAGIRCTQFDMYSYHTHNSETHTNTYREDQLVHEVYSSLDIPETLKELFDIDVRRV